MLNQTLIKTALIFLAALLVTAPAQAFAEGIKARMTKRLPVIVSLKEKGIVGENNKGYLEFVTSKKTSPSVVAGENKDRKLIYTHIAKQEGVDLTVVENRRARKRRADASAGEFIQDHNGKWRKK